jgi:hypothetical protein
MLTWMISTQKLTAIPIRTKKPRIKKVEGFGITTLR